MQRICHLVKSNFHSTICQVPTKWRALELSAVGTSRRLNTSQGTIWSLICIFISQKGKYNNWTWVRCVKFRFTFSPLETVNNWRSINSFYYGRKPLSCYYTYFGRTVNCEQFFYFIFQVRESIKCWENFECCDWLLNIPNEPNRDTGDNVETRIVDCVRNFVNIPSPSLLSDKTAQRC